LTEHRSGVDILGIKPIADATKIVVKGSVDGASAFLSRICLPAAEEFGLLLRDKVRVWRARNAAGIATRAEKLLTDANAPAGVRAHPRLVGQILEQGSWSDSGDLQQQWAGLLASSCDESGEDDSNLMFVDLLSRLSATQVRILNFAVVHAGKTVSDAGLLMPQIFDVAQQELVALTDVTDLHRLDREVDHLVALGLLVTGLAGFQTRGTQVQLTPAPLALQMYVRCQGFRGDPVAFFGVIREST
jgi:hypothetical protein